MKTKLEDFLSPYPPFVRAITLQARGLILAEMPDALEMVDPSSRIIAYGFGSKYADLVFALAPFTDHVNVMFARGASLPDPHGLLRGTGKKARHARLETPDDLENLDLLKLIKTALIF